MDKKTSSSSQNGRGKFSGRIGYVMAVAGSAVGLGNIWRFPYLAAKYGGGIFLLVYLMGQRWNVDPYSASICGMDKKKNR